MSLAQLTAAIGDRFHLDERRHACAILAADFPDEFQNITECLNQFELVRSEIVVGGGGKTKIASRFDNFLMRRGWSEKSIKVSMSVDGEVRTLETHKVDFYKNRIAVEVEWNNKDPFFSRDLNAFRLLHDLGVISVGIIITRMSELQEIFDSLGYDDKPVRPTKIGDKYGQSTTHWGKLMPRVNSGGGGACPLLLIGITRQCYRDDMPNVAIRATP